MNWWEWFWDGIGPALISAVIALLTSIAFRWWERTSVRWIVVGEAVVSPPPPGVEGVDVARVELDIFNAGDGDAYDVRTIRCNGAGLGTTEVFEAGKVSAGASFRVTFSTSADNWESAWLIVVSRSRIGRNRPESSDRVTLSQVVTHGPGRPPSGFYGTGHPLPAAPNPQVGTKELGSGRFRRRRP